MCKPETTCVQPVHQAVAQQTKPAKGASVKIEKMCSTVLEEATCVHRVPHTVAPAKSVSVRKSEKCSTVLEEPEVVRRVTLALERIVKENTAPHTEAIDAVLREFESRYVPSISITDYIARIAKYAHCSKECYIIAMVYIDRFTSKLQTQLSIFNVHRLLLAALLLAAKGRDDRYYSNEYYGMLGGIQNDELNNLEMLFLDAIDWDLWVSPEVYASYVAEIRQVS